MKHKLLLIAILSFYTIGINAQDVAEQFRTQFFTTDSSYEVSHLKMNSTNTKRLKLFIAYDFGEAVFNQFRSLGGEVGVRFKNDHLIRLAYTHLYLTEKHLSSDFAKAVDGENVKGKQVGFELFYDFPVFIKGLYIAPSVGYYDHEYTHTISGEQLKQSSFIVGTAISFTETDVLKIKGLYYRVSIPIRFHFDPIKESQLGDAIIKSNQLDNSIWFFIGFEF
ncbi:hypothetical protein KMW28_24725 [Flammeovirga yaeyamensis]|uniref:Outer membrane protein beta-barrel domain-containing protein n=1 Tax=Flammeovirga yaeyamensis TaxID=367791 RepID=A0AAX1NDJ9_9BACT|nr:hypothetical protein [Flammeovirga yaeyamensis]MBB3699506.1 hypothetical protein [Flammeovirga yaeyamensis]NMF35237.1 hypothetical protein [Flammeovirga yaeyamensis]QWG04098.1 hypothetical protein KMW28_24725 [Flammeovirga yaeyamensis]